MAAPGRPALRDLFDDAQTPLIGHPPRTHHLEYYVATDGSYREERGGLGAVIEAHDGRRVARVARSHASPDNNVAEYRALHLGLDVLAPRIPPGASVGILVDHDRLARNVNAVALGRLGPADDRPIDVQVPPRVAHHWRGVLARLAALGDVRAARIDGSINPAHPLANDPEAYDHLRHQPDRCVIARTPWRRHPDAVPPPSRARPSPSD